MVCSAVANPKETDFSWSLKNENDTLEQIAEMRNGRSYMLLDTSITNFRTYVCVANNTIGHSVPCERDIPGWYSKLFIDSLIAPSLYFLAKKVKEFTKKFLTHRVYIRKYCYVSAQFFFHIYGNMKKYIMSKSNILI